MYDLIDRPVAGLAPVERLLLEAMRRWVHALTLAAAPLSAVANRFADGGGGFDAVMRRLDRDSLGSLAFPRPCHATVDETEAVVLGLWRQAIAGELAAAQATAALLVAPRAAAGLVGAMRRLARSGALRGR